MQRFLRNPRQELDGLSGREDPVERRASATYFADFSTSIARLTRNQA